MNHFVVNFDPAIFSIGPIQLRWYGLMYVVGFVVATYIYKRLIRENLFHAKEKDVDVLITYLLIGLFLGARIFYVFLYNWSFYSQNLLDIIAVWKGGLSYHGGLTGIIVGALLWAKKYRVLKLNILDASVIAASQGPFFGRLGNFLNGELYGRMSDVPWAMVFPHAGPYPRHPSQLYESIFEAGVVFLILWFNRGQMLKRPGFLGGLYLILYGVARFIIEFFREPDEQLGYLLFATFTMGHILCFLMIAAGSILILRTKKNWH